VFEQQRKDGHCHLWIDSQDRKVGGNVEEHWGAVPVQSLPHRGNAMGEQWPEFDTLSPGGSMAFSSVCRVHIATLHWRDCLFSRLEECLEFFNRKLYVLNQQ
jgi:hypothetical protein